MKLTFQKMNGAGNDFVVINNRKLNITLTREQITLLCDRQRGVGADGLLAVEPAEKGADFKFRYYNADGGEAEMCGNGARCFARYAASLIDSSPTQLTFETIAGTLGAEIMGEDVRIAMSDPFDLNMQPPVELEKLNQSVYSVNTGVPHAVVFVDDLENLDVIKHGAALRYHPYFAPNGTNANFAHISGNSHIAIRTYERGVENETLACGTGMTACALIHHLLTGASSPVKVDVAGGETLEIGFEKTDDNTFQNVTLTGPADFVFEGSITI